MLDDAHGAFVGVRATYTGHKWSVGALAGAISLAAAYMKSLLHTLLFICILFLGSSASAQNRSVFEVLSATEGQLLTLSIDLNELVLQKKTNNYIAATLNAEGIGQMAVEVRARGKFRRRTCEIPPLKLKFTKKKLASLGITDSLNEVKLVLPCVDDRAGEDFILREYTAYRLYEQLSDYHVRARLVKVAIKDTHKDATYMPVWAMLVEHEEEVAARLQGTLETSYSIQHTDIQPELAAINATFQYMIGNTDWDLLAHRNVYLLRKGNTAKLIPIPYDFDFSGLVNAAYAVPNSDYGLTSLQQRHWLGQAVLPQHRQLALRIIQEKRGVLEKLCKTAFVGERNTRPMLRYLNSFFEENMTQPKAGR